MTVIGSEPVRIAEPGRDDPFGTLQLAGATEPDRDGAVLIGGGWVGWLGYSLGWQLERLAPPPPPAVARPLSSLALYDHVLIHDGQGWYFESLGPADAALERWRRRLRSAPPQLDLPPAVELVPTGSGAAGHVAAVTDCLERIAAGDLYQANLCLRLSGPWDGQPLALFARGMESARPRMGAYVDGVISLSPERFLRRSGRQVWAEPMKGTRPRDTDPGQLAASAKDGAEHVMIVDLMRNDLGRVCAFGSVQVQAPRVEPHSGVWQLVSTVSGTLRDGVGDGDLLRATFPPGSVTGAPKLAAMEAISALESVRRECYTGAVGMVSPIAGLDLNVAIRTFEVAEGQIWFGVGGGVVADSEPEAELAEALTKAAGPLAAVGGRLMGATSEPSRRITALPRALSYGHRADPGEGVFETLWAAPGAVMSLDLHLERLTRSLQELYGTEPDGDVGARALSHAHGLAGPARLRLLATPDGQVEITSAPLGPGVEPGGEPLALTPFLLPGGWGAHKWRDRRLLDALSQAAPGTVPLLVDGDGTVLEAAHANVWIVEGARRITPPIDGRILPGITRARLLRNRRTATEERIDLSRLAAADQVLLSSSISRLVPARLASAAS